jgi:hypothetical protein
VRAPFVDTIYWLCNVNIIINNYNNNNNNIIINNNVNNNSSWTCTRNSSPTRQSRAPWTSSKRSLLSWDPSFPRGSHLRCHHESN